jgi:hypothetical protein
MQGVDSLICVVQLGEATSGFARDQLTDPVGHTRRDLAQLGEEVLELMGNRVLGMSEASRVGNVRREITHPLDLLRAVHRSENRAQVPGDRRLQRQQ